MMTMKRYLFLLTVLLGTTLAWGQEEPLPTADSTAATAPGASTPEKPAVTPDALWDQANTAYINGDYHRAAEGYEALLDEGYGSMKLYYNLANAYFKEGRTGRAILFYHRALRLAPGNEDIRYNLRVAEARTKDTIEQIPEFFLARWLRDVRHTMGCTAWSILSLAALTAALGLFLIYLLATRLTLRKWGFYGTLAAALLFVVTTWFAAGVRREMTDESQAVVMSGAAAVKSSPDRASTDLFVLHEGTLVEITSRLDGWAEVTIADGKKGWIETKAIETI